MQIPRDVVLLRIFFGEDGKFERLPLHEAIVLKSREMQLGGATVLRGHIGFGHSSHIHTTNAFLRICRWWWKSSIRRKRWTHFFPSLTR
jgi:PII-like signaling protein